MLRGQFYGRGFVEDVAVMNSSSSGLHERSFCDDSVMAVFMRWMRRV